MLTTRLRGGLGVAGRPGLGGKAGSGSWMLGQGITETGGSTVRSTGPIVVTGGTSVTADEGWARA